MCGFPFEPQAPPFRSRNPDEPDSAGTRGALEGLKGDQWRAALPLDGVFDSQYEQFSLSVPLKEGKATVELRVRDAAGNLQTQTVKWPKEEPKDEEKAKEERAKAKG